jgi:hypothetical protein
VGCVWGEISSSLKGNQQKKGDTREKLKPEETREGVRSLRSFKTRGWFLGNKCRNVRRKLKGHSMLGRRRQLEKL